MNTHLPSGFPPGLVDLILQLDRWIIIDTDESYRAALTALRTYKGSTANHFALQPFRLKLLYKSGKETWRKISTLVGVARAHLATHPLDPTDYPLAEEYALMIQCLDRHWKFEHDYLMHLIAIGKNAEFSAEFSHIRDFEAQFNRFIGQEEDTVLCPLNQGVAENFGNLAAYSDFYAKATKLGIIPPRLVVIPTLRAHLCNRFLAEQIPFPSRVVFVDDNPEYNRALPYSVLSPLQQNSGRNLTLMEAYAHTQRLWEQAGHASVVRFPKTLAEECWQALRDATGMKPNDWFVVLNMRQNSAYYQKTNRIDGNDAHRNQTIEPSRAALSCITDRGGWVVRLGAPDTPSFPAMPHLFDYAHSSIHAPEMDVFLLAQARFVWSTCSGPAAVAWLYGTPFAGMNWTALGQPPPCSAGLFTPKLLYSSELKRYITLEEMLSDPFRMALFWPVYHRTKIQTIENDAKDLRALLIETLDWLETGEMPPPTPLQQQVQQLFEQAGIVLNPRLGHHFLERHASKLGLR